MLGVPLAVLWGRRHGANVARELAAPAPRRRVTPGCLGARWAPEAGLRPQAQAWRRALPPPPGAPIALVSEAAQPANRGPGRAGVAKRPEPGAAPALQGPQAVWAMLVDRAPGLPWGRRRDAQPQPAQACGRPVRQPTAVAAHRLPEVHAPSGGTVLGRCAAAAGGPTGGHACRAPGGPWAATLQGKRRRCTPGGQLQAGRDGKPGGRRRRPRALGLPPPHGRSRDRDGDAGGLTGRPLGAWPVVVSRHGAARKRLGLGPAGPALSAAGLSQTEERRWAVARC